MFESSQDIPKHLITGPKGNKEFASLNPNAPLNPGNIWQFPENKSHCFSWGQLLRAYRVNVILVYVAYM